MRPTILGAVEREDFKAVEKAAKELWWQPYWNTFKYLDHLQGWLLTNHHCAYCGVDLLDDHIPSHRAHTDHLLPHRKYPELKITSRMNAVASCQKCNSLKSGWDPNEADPIYRSGEELSYETRRTLIKRVIAHLDGRSLRVVDKEEFIKHCRAAAKKAEDSLA